MQRFLVDENLSPALAHWLRGQGYDAEAVRDAGLKGADDKEILKYLLATERILITSDLDFGAFFYGRSFGSFGVIIIRGAEDTEAVQEILKNLDEEGVLSDTRLTHSLIVVSEKGYRWRRFSRESS